jgi:hypothetical protein
LTGAGSAKDALQNLELQGFRGQNLDIKELRPALAILAQAPPRDNLLLFEFLSQGWTSHGSGTWLWISAAFYGES